MISRIMHFGTWNSCSTAFSRAVRKNRFLSSAGVADVFDGARADGRCQTLPSDNEIQSRTSSSNNND
jgi:hypothetical protein